MFQSFIIEAWHKKFCSSSKKVAMVLNGKYGGAAICAEFSHHFQSACQPNTSGADAEFKAKIDKCMANVYNAPTMPHIELILLDLYNDQLCLDDLQFGFKNNLVAHMLCLHFKKLYVTLL